MRLPELPTPALIVDLDALEFNLRTMSDALPGERLRPHVKAHKCTALAARQAEAGHRQFCCATAREMIGMSGAGLGEDLLLANEIVDPGRLSGLARLDARVTIAVDSAPTIEAAAAAGISEVLIDVNVGLPRCGCDPADAGLLAELASEHGMAVRGVMGYEGHVVGIPDREQRAELTAASMQMLAAAHEEVGGELVSAGGTGTYDLNKTATEIQAGSYVLMDTAYGRLDIPFRQAVFVLSTVVSVSDAYVVADCGLKAFGMDHGNPSVDDAAVWFCSDEHLTFALDEPVRGTLNVGDRICAVPAHVDPTLAKHERMHLVSGSEVLDTWEIDLRHW